MTVLYSTLSILAVGTWKYPVEWLISVGIISLWIDLCISICIISLFLPPPCFFLFSVADEWRCHEFSIHVQVSSKIVWNSITSRRISSVAIISMCLCILNIFVCISCMGFRYWNTSLMYWNYQCGVLRR